MHLKKKKIGILIILAFSIGMYMISGCAAFGTRPDKARRADFSSSKNFNVDKNIFQNRRPDIMAEMKSASNSWGMAKDWFKGGPNTTPPQKLPEVKPDFNMFMEQSEDVKVIWFGHSTFLINMAGTIILVDPVFSGSAAPVSFLAKRFQPPVVPIEKLPPIDIVLLSHDHYDHLDMYSIKFFKDKITMFIAPLGVGSHLAGWGIEKNRIVEKDWWESHTVGDIEFIAAPAQHFSGRDGIHNNTTLWASWVIRNPDNNIYFSGDSGYDIHFKAIGDRFGPFDIAFIESGQYNTRWEVVHLMPKQFVRTYQDLRAKKYFPVHWGMFELALHEWNEPVEYLYEKHLKKDVNLIAPRIGQVVSTGKSVEVEKWWDLKKVVLKE